MEWNTKQKEAFELAKLGINLLILGSAGTGKSTLLKGIIQELKENKKNVVILAPSGVAAYNVGGQTIHSFLRLPARPLTKKEKLSITILEKADVVILDEISMVRVDLFYNLARAIRKAEEKSCKRIQFIVAGDFFQIPPVVNREIEEMLKSCYGEEYVSKGFPFACRMWRSFRFTPILLEEIMRQSDREFCEKLKEVRDEKAEVCEWFNEKCQRRVEGAITLSSYKEVVDKINMSEIDKLTGQSHYYYAKVSKTLDKVYFEKPVEEEILVKVGMRVMSLVNDSSGTYENGTIGTVMKTYKDCIEIWIPGRGYAYVRPYKYSIVRHEFVNGKIVQRIIGNYTQLPIRPAYAITVHKCQGLTLDAVNIQPDFFEAHMAYVALSRCRTLEGIGLLGELKKEHIWTLDIVKDFYENLT